MQKLIMLIAIMLFTGLGFATTASAVKIVEIDDGLFNAVVTCDEITIDKKAGTITFLFMKVKSGNMVIKRLHDLGGGEVKIYLGEGTYCILIDGVQHEFTIPPPKKKCKDNCSTCEHKLKKK